MELTPKLQLQIFKSGEQYLHHIQTDTALYIITKKKNAIRIHTNNITVAPLRERQALTKHPLLKEWLIKNNPKLANTGKGTEIFNKYSEYYKSNIVVTKDTKLGAKLYITDGNLTQAVSTLIKPEQLNMQVYKHISQSEYNNITLHSLALAIMHRQALENNLNKTFTYIEPCSVMREAFFTHFNYDHTFEAPLISESDILQSIDQDTNNELLVTLDTQYNSKYKEQVSIYKTENNKYTWDILGADK